MNGWPYCAKAIIEHEYYEDRLNIWLTFSLPMNQKVMPLLTSWKVFADIEEVDLASSQWQDAYTLKLVTVIIVEQPARVLVKYEGKDSRLETTWKKNWEPWGYIKSRDIT